MKNRIIDFLAQGLRPSQVAGIVGCTPSYVVQLSKDEEVAKLIAEKRQELLPNLDDDKILTNKYMSAEHAILKQIEDNISMYEPRDTIRALEVIGNRQEKRLQRLTPAAAPNQGPVFNVLNLTLPAHAAASLPSYKLNESKEIIEVAGQALAPLSTEGVRNLFMQHRMQDAVQAVTQIEAPEDF